LFRSLFFFCASSICFIIAFFYAYELFLLKQKQEIIFKQKEEIYQRNKKLIYDFEKDQKTEFYKNFEKRFSQEQFSIDLEKHIREWKMKILTLHCHHEKPEIISKKSNIAKILVSFDMQLFDDRVFFQFIENLQTRLPALFRILSFRVKKNTVPTLNTKKFKSPVISASLKGELFYKFPLQMDELIEK
jgi:hypothetical protein